MSSTSPCFRRWRDRRRNRDQRGDQGRDHHLGQGDVFRRRRFEDAGGTGRRLPGGDGGKGPRGGGEAPLRGIEPADAALPAAGDEWQAGRGGDQRYGSRRRLRVGARLPSPDRRRRRKDQARPAGGEGRADAGRRRHAARRPPRRPAERSADAPEGPAAFAFARQGDEAGRSGGAARGTARGGEGLAERLSAQHASVGRGGLQAARRQGPLARRLQSLSRRQRALSPRDL